jgi:hypothetical protein
MKIARNAEPDLPPIDSCSLNLLGNPFPQESAMQTPGILAGRVTKAKKNQA